MNYSVHAIMYGYYFLTAVKAWPKWLPASMITVAQISQMIVGTTICIMSWVYLYDNQPCAVERENVIAGGLMYGSYLYLFAEVRKQARVVITTTAMMLLCTVITVIYGGCQRRHLNIACLACFLLFPFFRYPPSRPLPNYSSLSR